MRNKSLAKNSVYNILYSVLSLIFPLITSIYVSRVLAVDNIGKVAVAQNLVSYFVSFAPLGIPTYGIREIAKQQNNSLEKNRVFTELFMINFISTGICIIIYLTIMFNVKPYSNDILLCLACGLSLFFNFINIDWLYKGEEEYGYITARSFIVKIISLGCLFLFVRKRNDYVIYALINSLANCLNYILNIIHSRKLVRFEFHGLKFSRHMKPIMILFVSIILSSIYSKIDITMLGILSTDYAVAYYQYSFRIVEMIISACTAITTVFLPRLSFLYIEDREHFHLLLEFGLEVLIFLSVPMTIGLFLVSGDVLIIFFGNAFAPATLSLKIMSSLIIIKSIGNLLCYQLAICTGNEVKRLPAYASASIMNVIINAIMIPRFAQNGAVIATVASELIVNSIMLFSLRNEISFSIKVKPIMQAIISTTLMAIIVLGCQNIIANIYIRTFTSVLLGVFIYFLINLILKNQILMSGIRRMKEVIKHDI